MNQFFVDKKEEARDNPQMLMSFRSKVLLVVWGFSLLFIVLLFLLQIVFFEGYYKYAKEVSVKSAATRISQLLLKDRVGELMDIIDSIADDDGLCISLVDSVSYATNTWESKDANCLIHSDNRKTLNNIVSYYEASNQFGITFERVIGSPRNNEKSYLLIRDVVGYSGYKYYLVISSSLTPLKSTQDILLKQIIVISLILLLAGFFSSLLISRFLTFSIFKISKAARAVAKGNFDAKVNVRGKDEIAQLATDFNYMVDELGKVETTRHMLLANISHDLRTPLTMIKGYAETVRDLTGDSPEKRNKQLEIIIRESDRLSSLVDDVLCFTTLQQQTFELEKSEFDLGQALVAIVERYQHIAPGFRINYEGRASFMVFADKKRIEQVVYNLLNNAINHAGEDQQVIVKVDLGKVKCRVAIVDHGCGMTSEEAALIWDRYYKVKKSGKRLNQGTGLGLSIVKSVLDSHQTEFGVNSVLNQGSEFWFKLPLSKE